MARDPGKKNRLIAIKRKVSTNTGGDVVTTYATVATVWAEFRPLRTGERFASDATHSVRAGNFVIYHRDGLDPTMVIEWDGVVWEIKGIEEYGYRDELGLNAEAVY